MELTKDNYEAFIKHLERLTRERGLYKTAQDIGVQPKTLYRVFELENTPSLKLALALADVLGVKVSLSDSNVAADLGSFFAE